MADKEASSTHSSGFLGKNATAEDVFKSQTVGLVHLAEFRKRRAEALETRDHDTSSGAATPSDRSTTPTVPVKKKKKIAKGKLSFAEDDEGSDSGSKVTTPRNGTNARAKDHTKASNGLKVTAAADEEEAQPVPIKLRPNAAVGSAPRLITKSAQMKEAQMREKLRKEFLVMQEAVKATEMALPFVFYDGTNIPGSVCRVKKGEHVWLFLDKARKLGAEIGVGGGDKGKRDWARIGVDDLMMVRGEIIVPHHYDFYYFLVNKSRSFSGLLFNHSAEPTEATPKHLLDGSQPEQPPYNPLQRHQKGASAAAPPVANVEGLDDDPSLTKVVDRRWYEKNKHIYPASVWEEFDPSKDYTKGIRKDASGNTFFFG